MKGGIVFSNFVTTVSPTYANEIHYTELGKGLQTTLQQHSGKFGGVLNGIDYSVWNSEIDPLVPHQYGVHTLNEKVKNKTALRERLMLQPDFKPIIAVVSRLDAQKGTHLILHSIFYALQNRAQFVLLGSASEPHINAQFWDVKRRVNDNPDCHLELSYNEELAHLIYAGADMILIPSIYEPCGLTQLIGLKYGTVPIVRRTGGLADTVFDANYSDRPFEERNGYVFNDLDNQALESALSRALGLWYKYPRYFRQLQESGMNQDYSWNYSGNHYLNIYNFIKA
jgi:starch synthase